MLTSQSCLLDMKLTQLDFVFSSTVFPILHLILQFGNVSFYATSWLYYNTSDCSHFCHLHCICLLLASLLLWIHSSVRILHNRTCSAIIFMWFSINFFMIKKMIHISTYFLYTKNLFSHLVTPIFRVTFQFVPINFINQR